MATFYTKEKATATYQATLLDQNETALDGSTLDTMTLTLYNSSDGTVINSRNAQSVLNTNGVTITSQGALTWVMEPDDNPILGTGKYEKHIALFRWTWGSGKAGNHEVEIYVQNRTKIT